MILRASSFPSTMNILRAVVLACAVQMLSHKGGAAPLTTLQYHIAGSALQVTPPVLSVPKGIAGSVLVQMTGTAEPPRDVFVEATLRGPAFPARQLVGQVNTP